MHICTDTHSHIHTCKYHTHTQIHTTEHMYTGGQGRLEGVFLHPFPPYCFERGSLTELKIPISASLAGQELLVICLFQCWEPEMQILDRAWVLGRYWGFEPMLTEQVYFPAEPFSTPHRTWFLFCFVFVFPSVIYVLFWDRVSCRPDLLQTPHAAEDELEPLWLITRVPGLKVRYHASLT